ncbi:MAG: hypothetical protein ABJA02_13530 [Acidobacteriota bacterium]
MKKLNVLIWAVLIGMTIQTASGQTAAEFIKRAQAAQVRGESADQIMFADRAIKLDPQNAFAYFIRGGGYFAISKYEEAIADASRVIEIDPTIAAPYFLRGSALLMLRPADWKIALADFDKEIELDPTYPNAFRMRAMIYTEHTDKAAAAFADADKAVGLDAAYADAYQERGRADVDLKRFGDADNDYTTAIKLGKNTSKIYNLRSIAKFGENKRDEAIADLRRSLELDPNNSQAKENLDYALNHVLKTNEQTAPMAATPAVSQANISFSYALNSDTYEKVMPGVEKLFKKLTTHRYPAAKSGTLFGRQYVVDAFGSDKAEFAEKMNRVLQAMRNILDDKYVGELTVEQLKLCRARLDYAVDMMDQAAKLHLTELVPAN